jgi:uncharacterized membrane protein YcaP (DUF421 family)
LAVFNLDWHGIFAPSVPFLEIIVRGTIVYLVLFALLRLVKNGRLLRKNMRQELITEDELMSHLRRVGINDLAEVAEAHMEGDGSITFKPKS